MNLADFVSRGTPSCGDLKVAEKNHQSCSWAKQRAWCFLRWGQHQTSSGKIYRTLDDGPAESLLSMYSNRFQLLRSNPLNIHLLAKTGKPSDWELAVGPLKSIDTSKAEEKGVSVMIVTSTKRVCNRCGRRTVTRGLVISRCSRL